VPDYALINQCLYEGKAKEVAEMTQAALDEDLDVFEILNAGLIDGMSVVGEDFKHNVLYVPQVLIAARAMKAGLALLKPLLEAKADEMESPGTVIMGTVQGDLHDIGKNLVCMMAEGAGFTIVDLGTDTSLDKFEAAVREHKADIVGMSALLTTTMRYMQTVVTGLEDRGLGDVATIIGGAPVSQMYADEIGADGYGIDAPSAVDRFLQLVEARRAK
jgi:5-methyltetrahydrofolate--homocysteine methyltransferase